MDRVADLVKRLLEQGDLSVAEELTSYGAPVVSHILVKAAEVFSPEPREAALYVIGKIDGPVTEVLLDYCYSIDEFERCMAVMAIDDRVAAGKPDCIPHLDQIRVVMQAIAENDPYQRARWEARSVLRELDRKESEWRFVYGDDWKLRLLLGADS